MLKALGGRGRGIGKLIIYTENVTEAFNPRIVKLVCRDIYSLFLSKVCLLAYFPKFLFSQALYCLYSLEIIASSVSVLLALVFVK